MKTTQELAALLGVTVQSVNRYIRKACEAEGISVSEFGTVSSKDKRIRTFSENEVDVILKYAPQPKQESEQPIVAELVEEVEPAGQIVRSAAPLLGFGGVQNLVINLTVADTTELDQQTLDLQSASSQGFNVIAQLLTGELKAEVAEVRSQNKNAVRAAQAVAVTSVAQELGKS